MSLRNRITSLEDRLAPTEPEIITIRGGLCEFDDTHATIDGATLLRETDEPFPAFRARVIANAKATGAASAIIGGLPD
jgi:hypothetical protein